MIHCDKCGITDDEDYHMDFYGACCENYDTLCGECYNNEVNCRIRKSKLFGERELELLEQRIKGNKKDPTGLWSRKVKPKVTELITDWIPRKKELKKAIEIKEV